MRWIENGYMRSVVGDCEAYDLEQSLYLVNSVSEIPFTVNHLLKNAYDTGCPRILCKVVDDLGLIHERTEFDRDSEGLISHTVQDSIECFLGFFRLDASIGGNEFLKGLAYYDKPTTGIGSIVKEYSNGDVSEFRICDMDYDCLVADCFLKQQGEPDYIPTGEFFPALSALYITKFDLDVFIQCFVKVKGELEDSEAKAVQLEPLKENHKAWIIQQIEQDFELSVSGSREITSAQLSDFKTLISSSKRGYRAGLMRRFKAWYESNRQKAGKDKGKTPFNEAWKELGLNITEE